jgi:hypothetical protein
MGLNTRGGGAATKHGATIGGSSLFYRADGATTGGDAWRQYKDLLHEAANGNFTRVPAELRGSVQNDIARINDAAVRLQSEPAGVRLSDILRATPASNVQAANPLSSMLSIQYGNDVAIGLNLAPVIPVDTIAGNFPSYDKAARMADSDDDEGGGDVQEHDDGARDLDNSWNCVERSRRNVLPLRTMRNQQAPFDEMLDLLDALAMRSSLMREIRIAAAFQTSGNYGTTVTPPATEKWDSTGGGDPKGVITTALSTLWSGNGATKRVAFCGKDVWDVLKSHPALLDVTKYTSKGYIDLKAFAELMELDEFYVGSMRKRTSKKGQTATYSRVWGNYFGALNVPKSSRLRNVTFGATFRFGPEETNVEFTRGQVGSKAYPSGAYVATNVHNEDYQAGIAADAGYLVINPLT